MIGIDIVDLTDPKLRIRNLEDLRFLLHPNDNFDSTLSHIFWKMWAAKESVFKAHRERKVFKPKEIEILCYPGRKFTFKSNHLQGEVITLDNGLIAVAYDQGSTEAVAFNHFKIAGIDPPAEIRHSLANFLSSARSYSIDQDEKNLPILTREDVTIPLSFSHHHSLGAFAFITPLE